MGLGLERSCKEVLGFFSLILFFFLCFLLFFHPRFFVFFHFPLSSLISSLPYPLSPSSPFFLSSTLISTAFLFSVLHFSSFSVSPFLLPTPSYRPSSFPRFSSTFVFLSPSLLFSLLPPFFLNSFLLCLHFSSLSLLFPCFLPLSFRFLTCPSRSNVWTIIPYPTLDLSVP